MRKDEVSLEDDPDSAPENLAFRSGRKIEAGYILRSKKEPAEESLASESFKNQFNAHPSRIERNVLKIIDAREAAEMLHGEQTDSESDEPLEVKPSEGTSRAE